ncbi:MAG: 50S ribosomal protein L32e [Thermoplasmata archaeon HGW-Thermoplasmata-2]|nr:MAG: 50S ribosomal protein L32e [Thermoplasmata archaeon HGW-Thermoplasmata-2]
MEYTSSRRGRDLLSDVTKSKIESKTKSKEAKYTVKKKPKLTAEKKKALTLRNEMNVDRPEFHRQQWFRYVRLGDEWRKPVGSHSKSRRSWGYRPPNVKGGYRGPSEARGLHPSGFEEVRVFSADELNGVKPDTQAVRIGGTVGAKKRIDIVKKADELGIRVLNRGV